MRHRFALLLRVNYADGRILSRRPGGGAAPSLLMQTPGGVRLRAKEFTPTTRDQGPA